jgi:predicted Zn finger-like uncharacterized protein
MILTCPQCATRYQTDAALFGAEGRKVRCAKCGYVWHQAPEAPAEADPEYVQIDEPETPPAQHTAYAPTAYVPTQSTFRATAPAASEPVAAPAHRGDWAIRLGVAAGWAALTALVILIGWSVVHYRQPIARLWPQTASFYALLGKPVNTTGIVIGHLKSRDETENGEQVLAITGKLTNVTTHEIAVPQIVATLTDDDRRVLYNWSFSANIASLKPGQTVGFVTRVPSPPDNARHLEMRLAENGK